MIFDEWGNLKRDISPREYDEFGNQVRKYDEWGNSKVESPEGYDEFGNQIRKYKGVENGN